MRIIKKYLNRRLYDTTLGAYITLDDVKRLVLDHVSFQVIDAKTKKDITQTTLLQIITEQETTTPIFTIPLLQDFIRFYQDKSQHIVTQYLEQMMQLFVQQKSFFENQWLSYQKFFTDPSLIKQALTMQKIWAKNASAVKKRETAIAKKNTRKKSK